MAGKGDITESYGNPLLPMQLRIFAQYVYGGEFDEVRAEWLVQEYLDTQFSGKTLADLNVELASKQNLAFSSVFDMSGSFGRP